MAVPGRAQTMLQRFRAHIPKQVRKVGAKLAEWDGAGGDAQADPSAKPDRLHHWLPFAIVAVSVLAASMGWQASVADERATRHDEVSRQDLVRLEQIKLQKQQAVDAELRTFGDYERYALLARELRRDVRRSAPPERRRLAGEVRANSTAASSLRAQLKFSSGAAGSRNPYDVQLALTQAETGDPDLSSVEPNLLRAQARKQRTKGLHLTELAVLFIAGLVFFTLAAVSRGRRANTFCVFGTIVALIAISLFPFVRWT